MVGPPKASTCFHLSAMARTASRSASVAPSHSRTDSAAATTTLSPRTERRSAFFSHFAPFALGERSDSANSTSCATARVWILREGVGASAIARARTAARAGPFLRLKQTHLAKLCVASLDERSARAASLFSNAAAIWEDIEGRGGGGGLLWTVEGVWGGDSAPSIR